MRNLRNLLTLYVMPVTLGSLALFFFWSGKGEKQIVEHWQNLAVNLSSECVGILLTVYGVDSLNRQRHMRERVRESARDYILEIFHSTWHWLPGLPGDKRTQIADYQQKLQAVTDSDAIELDTRKSLIKLGWRAMHEINVYRDGRSAATLIDALDVLEELCLEEDMASSMVSRRLRFALCQLDVIVPDEFGPALSETLVKADFD